DGKVVYAVVRTRVNLAAVWDMVEADQNAVGIGAHGFLLDDYGIRLAVSETKGHREQAESLIYKPIAAIDPEPVTKLVADKRVRPSVRLARRSARRPPGRPVMWASASRASTRAPATTSPARSRRRSTACSTRSATTRSPTRAARAATIERARAVDARRREGLPR